MVGTWAAVASDFSQKSGGGTTPDGFVLARCCGLDVHPRVQTGTLLCGKDIFYDAQQPWPSQRASVAAAVATWLLQRRGIPASAEAVDQVAAHITGTKALARAGSISVVTVVADPAAARANHL